MVKNKKVINEVKTVSESMSKKIKKVKMIDEFKEFIARGNVLDLAVGVIIGASFQSLVTSLTNNIISPVLGCFGEVDFSDYTLEIGNLSLKYGAFLTDIINFIITAFIIFLIVKFVNKLLNNKKEEEKQTPPPSKSDELKVLEEIRDMLEQKTKNDKKA